MSSALRCPQAFPGLRDYYLDHGESGFINRRRGDVHMLMTKRGGRQAPLAA
jgi:hypothetical protein